MPTRSTAMLHHCSSRHIRPYLILLLCLIVVCAAFSVVVTPENEAAALHAIELYDQARHAEQVHFVHEAVQLYERAIEAYALLAGAYNNLAMAVLSATGDRTRALATLQRGAAVASELNDNETLAAVYSNMGFVVREEAPRSVGHCLQAIQYYDRALDAVPTFVDALFNKASALRAINENAQAATLLRRVLQFRPDHHSALMDLGGIFFDWGDIDTAVAYQDAAIRAAPTLALKLGIMHNKGHFLRAGGALEEALRVHEDALALAPDDPMALTDAVIARRPLCVWESREEVIDRMVEAVARNNLSILLPYDSTLLPLTNRFRMQLAIVHSRTFEQSTTLELLPLRDIAVDTSGARRPLRVGYLSFDFRDHPMGHLTLGLLDAHDAERVRVHCYSYGANDDSEWRRRAERRCDTFVDGAGLSDLELAQRIALDKVDIVIDLMAHTTGARLGISALRPSRVIVNYLGFPGTMGSTFTDFALVDRFVVPPEFATDSMTEQIVYLPNAYQVNEYDLEVGACSAGDDDCMQAIRREEGLPEDAVVLCNFNTIDKMEPLSFGVWMNVLRRVPNSILWLLQPSKKHAPMIERSLKEEAEAHGVDSARIFFAPRVPKRRHLARVTAADLFLDSFVYNAHSTASDALWATVPLLTIWGDSFPSRVAGSLLSNLIDLPEVIPTSIKEYEDLAVLLATTPSLRSRIRTELGRHSLTAPLFDTKRTTDGIETAYEVMHDIRHGLNHSPQVKRFHIAVEPSQPKLSTDDDRTAAFVRYAVASGIAKQDSRKYGEAKSIYERILRSHPNEIDARHLLGVTLHQLGEHHQALKVLDEVRRRHPSVALFRYNRALVLLAVHRVEAAKAELQVALQLEPAYYGAMFQLINILLGESAFADVIVMYEKLGRALLGVEGSSHHVPDDVQERALLQYSFALTKSSQSDDALRILRTALERHPNYFRAGYNLAAIHIERGDYCTGDEWQVRAAVNEARHAFSTRGHFFTKQKRPHGRKVLVFYCHEYGQSWWDAWGPSSLHKGLGGSEEAVVFLSRELQRLGFWVEVYGDPPLEDMTKETTDRDAVKWYPHYAYNPEDREVDIFVAWRYHISLAVGAWSGQKYFWVHDVPSEDTKHSRLLADTVDGILCVSNYQASLFPAELQSKIVVTSNALDPAYFVDLDRPIRQRNHHFVYGSSPGRGLYDLLRVWPRIRLRIPDATLRVFYGFTLAFMNWGQRNIENFHMWRQIVDEMLKQPGVEYVGLVDHETLAKAYASAGFYLYPTTYSETSCVSLMKAMANGAIPITSRFSSSALRETCDVFDLGPRPVSADRSPIGDEEWLELWVQSIVDAIEHPEETETLRKRMIQFARHKYQWANVAAQWRTLFTVGSV